MDYGRSPSGSRSAARTAGLLMLAGAGGMMASEVTAAASAQRPVSWTVIAVGVALVVFGVALWSAGHTVSERLLSVCGMSVVVVIFGMNVLTSDASGGAQIAFLLPVVYAGAFLPSRAAWATAVLAMVGHGCVVFRFLPIDRAMTDSLFGVLAISALTTALVSGRRHQERLVARLDELARTDPLTGLETRRGFEERHGRGVCPLDEDGGGRAAPGRPLPMPTGMLVVDVDRFKDINDRHGHPAGDAALVQLAGVLRSVARPGDVALRLGGDEFGLVFPGISRDALAERADALRAAVRDAPLEHGGEVLPMTVSIGAAHDPSGSLDHESLYSAADTAMYEAKGAGRDCWAMALDDGRPSARG